jgi:DNA polymerase III delta prime subunit
VQGIQSTETLFAKRLHLHFGYLKLICSFAGAVNHREYPSRHSRSDITIHQNSSSNKRTNMNFYETTKPTRIRDFVPDNERDLQRLEMLVTNELTFPNPAKKAIILHGKYGTGKSELAKLLPRLLEEYRVEPSHRDNVRRMNESDLATFISCQTNNSADVIKRAMPTAMSFNNSRLHYVILDEVDNMKVEFQKSMKGSITQYDHLIYIMTTNGIKKVDDGLKSRSHLISFENPSKDLWMKRLVSICESFQFKYEPVFLENLISRSNCDARTMLSELEGLIKLETVKAT